MCGIVGTIESAGMASQLADMRRACDRLEHRGPDDFGYLAFDGQAGTATVCHRGATVWSGGAGSRGGPVNVALGHRRLSIIDLSTAAAQPMTDGSGQRILIHNGEIYNYRPLRRELEALGRTFRTSSDTEVLLAAYAQWGAGALQRLEGMFAFALLDLERRVLFLARDAFGIKPLYYAIQPGRFAFASEIPALLELPWVDRRANARRVYEHLNFWTTDRTDGTFLAGIQAVPGAHYAEIALDAPPAAVTPICYWRLERDRVADVSLDEAAASLRELFIESVTQHLQADVPWCVALSGGTDSSSVTMAARRILGREAPLHTVSFLANDPALNEEIWVDTVVRAAGATPHKLQIDDADLGEDFARLVGVQGQPMVTPVVYAQHRVFRHAGECGFKVLLEGQGADELLAGYPFYLQARLASMLKQGEWLRAIRFLWSAPPRFLAGRRHVLRHALHRAYPRWGLARASRFVAPWISRRWAGQHGVDQGPPPGLFDSRGPHYLREMIDDAVRETKLPSLLRYGDHNAMAASVENRVPFLTRPLAQFLFSLPEEYIMSSTGTSKNVLRYAMRGITPEFVLRRKNKIGFEPPYQKWMQAMTPALVATLERAQSMPVFDGAGVRAMVERLQREGVSSTTFANQVWRATCLAAWSDRFSVTFD